MNSTDLVQEIKNELAAGPAIADISCRDIVVKLGSPRGSPGGRGGRVHSEQLRPRVTGTGSEVFSRPILRVFLSQASPQFRSFA